jgi:hypothetical protein
MPIQVGVYFLVLILTFAGLDWPRAAFSQDKGGQGNAYRRQVDLVSVYFTVRDDKKRS